MIGIGGIISMSALDCYQLVGLYTSWLKERVKLKTIGDICVDSQAI